ncbi:hypothetical protein ACUY24_11465, partial [Corynebacterium simulans]
KKPFLNCINLGLISRVSSCHSSHSGLSPYAGWIPTHKPSDTLEDDAPYIFGHYSSFVTPKFSIVLGY